MIEEPREELDQFLALVSSPEWRVYLELKRRHSRFLQDQINMNLKKGDYRQADRSQAKLEENERDVQLLRKRMEELKSSLPKEEGFTNG